MIPVESLTEVPEGFVGIYTAGELDDIRNRSEVNYILINCLSSKDINEAMKASKSSENVQKFVL